MINLLTAIIVSFLFGLIMAVLMIAYFNFGEKVQEWSDSFSRPKQWARRVIHLTSMILAVVIIVYGFLIHASLVITNLREVTNSRSLLGTLFISCETLVVFPFLLLRKKILRERKVKKLWQ